MDGSGTEPRYLWIRKLATIRRSPRRTVRIVKHWTLPPTARLSLLVVFSVAVLVFMLWRFWQPAEVVSPRERTITDVEFVYKCERNHTFRALGQVGPRTCPICGQPAYPRWRYACEIHGTFEVALYFGIGADGVPKVTKLRLPGRDWVAVDKTLRCPRCNRELKRLPEDPLDLSRRRLPEGG